MVGNSTTRLLPLVCKRLGHTSDAVTGTWTSVPTSSCTNRLRFTLQGRNIRLCKHSGELTAANTEMCTHVSTKVITTTAQYKIALRQITNFQFTHNVLANSNHKSVNCIHIRGVYSYPMQCNTYNCFPSSTCELQDFQHREKCSISSEGSL